MHAQHDFFLKNRHKQKNGKKNEKGKKWVGEGTTLKKNNKSPQPKKNLEKEEEKKSAHFRNLLGINYTMTKLKPGSGAMQYSGTQGNK